MQASELQIKNEIIKRWDESSETYDDSVSHNIRSNDEYVAWMNALKKSIPPDCNSILDIGCGTGELSLLIAEMGYTVTGVDLSSKMLSKARSKALAKGLEIRFEMGDAESLPYEDETFDSVFTRHLLWTLPNPQKGVESWHRVLKNGGRVMIVDGVWNNCTAEPNAQNLTSMMKGSAINGTTSFKGHYPKFVEDALPNNGGTPLERTKAYMMTAGFRNINHIDLLHIREMQKKRQPLSERNWKYHSYYLAFAEK